ncbi:hypothetical protein KUTeg_017364 [Tegillarca granosa]|uniref:Uncharacterized protein n=1 Tax=Tegillarca granosa TaxID=220873 RepID=A0ABQ9EL36_TEGGR|nr:hypothetical protein KUTeg_017364 [Tegillarca granosa]
MEKSRSIYKLRKSLPQTPKRRSAVLQAYLEYKSPTAKTVRQNMFHETPNLKPVIDDLKSVINSLKMKRSNDARAAVNVICASVNGNSVQNSKSQKKKARILGLPIRRLSGGKAIRTRFLSSAKSSWTHTDKKTRSDSLSEQDKKLAYNFWLLPDNSRPTCNKRDVKRVHIGPKCYSSHMVSVLEKLQTDVYLEFKKAHSEIKMCQRTFERCKPFYVQPVRPRDRHTCLCRYHVEAKSVFKSCMNFRKRISENGQNEFPVYDHIDDLIKETICDHSDGNVHMDCLNRNCISCGVEFLKLQPEENDISDDAPKVQWNKYEYVEINGKKGKTNQEIDIC